MTALVALFGFGNMNAAAEDVVRFDFEDGTTPFTNSSRVTGAIENDATLNSNVMGWTCAGNAQNGYSFSYYDFTSVLDQPASVKVEFGMPYSTA